ncbi:MAG TPA: aldehyde dehydrogenase family protein [Verrucomicrobiae bacterium]|nr:aldehyde dehydrogenase family protein [Verrucomicrobiae bacterium]HTZ56032.1 aldehyde dehydrogenase family protein [Candidatus Acidoferrum sp.]
MTTLATPAPATPAEIEQDLVELREGAKRWVALRTAAKADLLEQVRGTVYAQAQRWAHAGAQAKGVDGTPLAGEEWVSGPWALLYALNRYIRTLRDLAHAGTPSIAASRVHERPDGQLTVDVFPNAFYDRLLLSGVRAEVWMQPGVTRENLASTMAVWYKQSSPQPRVALVLGAGNIAAIPPLDVLYKLIADGAVCILKMNPVNQYLGPIFEDALKPLVDGGFLRFAYGGAEVGKLLTEHPLVDEIHITGSDRTFNAIVRDMPVQKPITAELGNVSPTIVVPGPWSDADFRFQAEQIVTQKLHNDGFNCVASQVVILPSAWDGTPKLIAQIEAVMREAPPRPAYYPGAADRMQQLGGSDRSILRLDANTDAIAFGVEAFAPLIAVVELPGETAAFLRDAVAFANDRLWGNLGANVVAHPATLRTFTDDVDLAISGLRYGCVAVNAWTGVGFLLTETTWGAYPGNTIDDVRSGIGVVHNSYLFDRAQKSVVWAPFAPFPRSIAGYGATLLPKPPWFVTNRLADRIGEALVDFEVKQTPLAAMNVAMFAMRA